MALLSLYKSYEEQIKHAPYATLFDFIGSSHVDVEVRQTKSIAIALSYEPEFFSSFLKLVGVNDKDICFNTSMVMAESQWNKAKLRSDILILARSHESVLKKVIVIECKSKSVAKVSDAKIDKQISRYCKAIGCVFKRSLIIPIAISNNNVGYANRVKSISWNTLFTLVDNISKKLTKKKNCHFMRLRLFRDFKDYLLRGGSKMKYYEEEVVSIPAGNTIKGVEKYGVYACSNDKRHAFKDSIFLTFRPRGGKMTMLYKLEGKYIISKTDIKYIKGLEIDEGHKARIINFLKDTDASHYKYKHPEGTVVYLLDYLHVIKTDAHSSGQSPRGIAYYYLSDMLDEKQRQMLRPTSESRNR